MKVPYDVVLPQVNVLGSTMAYREAGDREAPVALFLHGNPTSSYIWRNILPLVAPVAHCIAPDLIGFGQSGKPDIEYRFADHVRYLDAFLDHAGISSAFVIAQDWGSALAFHLAARRPQFIRGLAFMEFIRPMPTWKDFHPEAIETFQKFRTPGVGEEMILQGNAFVEGVLPSATVRKLTEEEMSVYRAPFPTPQSRRPTWRFPNELPIAGEPAGVYSTIEKAHRALAQSSYPKLLFAGNPGALISPAFAESFAKELKNCRVVQLSSGIHYLQEDHPDVIGANVKEWLIELGVVDGHRLYKANQTEHLFEPPTMAGRRTATGQYFSVGLGDRAVQTTSPMQPPNSMRNSVKLTFFFAVASVQLTSALKISALQVRPTSKVVTMRLASVHQLQVGMKSGVTFEISKIQPADGALGNVQVIPSQQKPMIDGSPSLTVAGLQFVPNFQSAPVWLTPSQERPATVLVTVPFQVTTMEFSASFEIASVVLNSTSKEVIVQLPGAASTAGEGTPMFEIANLQLSEGGDIALMQLNLLGQGSKQT